MDKLLGGLCLIIGTTIGAGMLALPVVTAHYSLWSSSLLMIACWLLMIGGALLVLEANLWCHEGSNLISMARKTLGPASQYLTWLLTLLLLYSLLCAYISGGSQIVDYGLSMLNIQAAHWVNTCIFTLVMGSAVLCGIRIVDWLNRGLMGVKMFALLCLLIIILPYVKASSWQMHSTSSVFNATTVIMTSFGFANIIPSLRTYFKGDIQQLRKVILIGSAIPLVFYLAWIWVVHGIIPVNGVHHSLNEMQASGNASSHLAAALTSLTQSKLVDVLGTTFTSICVLTSFLGVALSLSDFLADGTKIYKTHLTGKAINMVLCFGPPMFIVMYFPSLFITALAYAGVFCLILLIFLPVLMVWNGRYNMHLSGVPQLKGGKTSLTIIGLLAITAIILSALGH